MTRFTSISNALVSVGAKPFATTVQALRDNPIAIAQGDPTAPKINQGALDRPTPGTQIRSRIDPQQSTTDNSGAGVVALAFQFMQVGTVRIAFEHSEGGGTGGTAFVRRTRNGASTDLAIFANAAAFVAREVDVPILPGDLVEVRFRRGAGSAAIRNIRIQTNGENLWSGFAQRVEGNTYA